MASPRQQNVTRLLANAAEGDRCAASELLPLVYEELRALAASYFRNERADHTLQATALVHEAYARLVDQTNIRWESRAQFFSLAARAMRNILVDHARAHGSAKRGGGWREVPLDGVDRTPVVEDIVDMVALDEALSALAALDERKARLVELRFFGGLTEAEAAEALGLSRTTASEEWRMARAWLKRQLRTEEP